MTENIYIRLIRILLRMTYQKTKVRQVCRNTPGREFEAALVKILNSQLAADFTMHNEQIFSVNRRTSAIFWSRETPRMLVALRGRETARERQSGRETERERDRARERQRQRQTQKQKQRWRQTQTSKQEQKQKQRHSERVRARENVRERKRQRLRQTLHKNTRVRERQRERERMRECVCVGERERDWDALLMSHAPLSMGGSCLVTIYV